MDAQHLAENPLDVSVRQFAQRPHRFGRARAPSELLTDSLPLAFGLWAELGQGSYGFLALLFFEIG